MKQAVLRQFDNFYQFSNTPHDITVIVTTRGLNLGFHHQSEAQISEHRQRVLTALQLSLEQLVCAQQIHSNGVCVVGSNERGRGANRFSDAIADTDALITKEKGIALAVFTADCLPIFLIDAGRNVVAIVHAGWKGTKKAIAQQTITTMHESFGTHAKDITAYFGPAIRRCCYEVGREFLDYFERGVYREKNRVVLDLIELNACALREGGVLDENIFDSGMCTVCRNDAFFSFRREKDTCGRQMALIVM